MSKTNNRHVKKYYDNDRLNRGYKEDSVTSSYVEKTPEENIAQKYEYLLPPVEVISEYEEIFPGTLDKILNMAKKEQELKYELEKCSIIAAEKAKKLGAIFAFFITSVICASTVKIASSDLYSALIFSLVAFSAVFGVALLSKFGFARNYRNNYSNRNRPNYQNNSDGKPRYNSNRNNTFHKKR